MTHKHIYFGHAFKEQIGWEELLGRFLRGGGTLLDLEYIVDKDRNRLASFGNVAGYIGMAAGMLAWCRQELKRMNIEVPSDMIRKVENLPLVDHIKALATTAITFAQRTPKVVIIGSNGLVGQGAVSLLDQLGIPVTKWTREDTQRPGPYPELLDYDILVNAIRMDKTLKTPFITEELIRRPNRSLQVIIDISCDTKSPNNPLPIYFQNTTFDKPTLRLIDEGKPLDIIAIPNLPSLLPVESSKDFSRQLLPYLLALNDKSNEVWKRTENSFQKVCRKIAPVPLPRDNIAALKTTLLQEHLWDWSQTNPIAYNIYAAMVIDGVLDLVAVSENLSRVVEKNEILRTNFFKSPSGNLCQRIKDDVRVSIVYQDFFTDIDQDQRYKAVDAYLAEQLSIPFDLESDPLFRVYILCIGENLHIAACISHSIIVDKWSLSLIIYYLTGIVKPKEPKLQYIDIAHWERNRWIIDRDEVGISPIEEKEKLNEKHINFWKNLLGSSLQVLQLPLDHSRPATQNFEARQTSYRFSNDVVQKAFAYCKSAGGDNTVFPFLLAVFKILLFRLCGESDIAVGSRISGRSMASEKLVIGPFSNNLVLRTYVHKDMTAAQTIEKVTELFKEVLSHKEVPLERLYEVLFGESERRTITPSSLFQIKFNDGSEVIPQVKFNPAILATKDYDLGEGIMPFDLITNAKITDTSISFVVHSNKTLFDSDRIDEMFSQYELLVKQVLDNPEANIVEYTLVTARSRALLPDPTVPLDATWRGSIQNHFQQNALKNPERIAVVYQDQKITYSALVSTVNRLANWLLKYGISSNDVVAIYGHRSPPVVVAIMGILTSGAAYTMMDPAYPSLRVKQCLDIAKPKAFVRISATQDPAEDLVEYLQENNIIILNLPMFEEIDGVLGEVCDSVPEIETTADSVAVITFTSGSTGLPKGVIGRHGPLSHYYPWMAERFGIGEGDNFSVCSGIAHDPLQRDIFTPLFFGAKIFIPTQEDIVQPGRLSRWMCEHSITVTCMTPALGQILTTIDNPSFTIDTLRNAFFVGDALIKRDVNRLKRLCPNSRCINMYGSTETQRSVGYFEVPSSEIVETMTEVMPAGIGMKGCDLILLNEANQLAGVGEVAEIYVRGHHLSLGYVGLEDQTKEKFLSNPFSRIQGDRMYRTGDLGRYTTSGILQCFGRADDQVKIRGFRIEIGEINATLSLHKNVKENVTIVREDVPGDKKLVAYVVPSGLDEKEFEPSELSKELRSFLDSKLPSYMVPSHIVIIQTMPLTPNGKINRQALPKVEASNIPNKPIRALTVVEDKLMRIWSRVLGLDVASPDDNFFEIGGHSILATRLTLEIAKEFSLNIPLKILFVAPTVTLMAKQIDSILTGNKVSSHEAVLDLNKEAELFTIPVPEKSLIDTYKKVENPQNFFLTGATGFLGAFLLSELLNSTTATIHCLVRSDNSIKGKERLIRNLTNHLIWNEDFIDRVVAVVGDLSKPNFGIETEIYNNLLESVDAVVHNGAHVHWLQPYEKLKETNVLGTIEALKFCSEKRLKPLHYVSTTSVYDDEYNKNNVVVKETDLLEKWQGLDGGYPQSKWVAEKIVQIAREKGTPCNIYRPGYVTGHSSIGVWNTDDFLCRLIKGCIELKAAPILKNASLDMAAVDFVTKTIVHLTLNTEENKSYNVTNSNEYSFEQLFDGIRSFGYELEDVPYEEWRNRLVEACKTGDNTLSPMITFFTENWDESLTKHPIFTHENMNRLLEPTNIRCPCIQDILPIYFSYLVRCGFIESPKEATNILGIDWDIIGSGVEMLTRTNRH